MSIKKQTGFTVIEVMLFLAITGLMVVGMVAGTSISIQTQRYHDSVRSFKSLVQEQYAEIVSTENNRLRSTFCGDGSATPVETEQDASVVGQSDCEIVGRYMVVKGGDISIYSVIANRNERAKPRDATDDITLMTNESYMRFGIDNSFVETGSMEWGAEIAWPSAGSDARTPRTPRNLSLLFIRSPDSGQVYTFSSSNVPEDTPDGSAVLGMITSEGRSEVTICIDSAGLLSNNNMFIYIAGHASSSSSVEALTNDHNELIGKETRC
jgi:type II secretory pathway pseudopilin PulG